MLKKGITSSREIKRAYGRWKRVERAHVLRMVPNKKSHKIPIHRHTAHGHGFSDAQQHFPKSLPEISFLRGSVWGGGRRAHKSNFLSPGGWKKANKTIKTPATPYIIYFTLSAPIPPHSLSFSPRRLCMFIVLFRYVWFFGLAFYGGTERK